MKAPVSNAQRLFGELLGTALLLAVVIGSGLMAERLSGGNVAVALLANTLATVGGLYILIEVFGPVSGAHFNPAVSLAMALRGELPWTRLAGYVPAQLLGAALGAVLALDFLYVAGMLVMLVLAIRFESSMYFEGALLMVLFGFVGTVALAKFLLRGEAIE